MIKPIKTLAWAGVGAFALAAGVAAVAQALVAPGPNKVVLPADWAKGTLYATVDRPDNKQHREFYASPEVVAAARAGKPIPDGAVMTMAAYMAQVDGNGVPVKDADGQFVKGNLVGLFAMQKGKGWGEDIPAAIRNGDWVYQTYTPDGKVNDKANLTACYQCHLPFAKDDYLTNLAKLQGKFPSQAAAVVKSGPTDVTVVGFAFGPTAIKVTAGQSVTWTNNDDTPHQITVTGSNQRSDVMLKGQSATLRFDVAGNIAYVCGLHPSMKGTIEVVAKN
jgi:plastocyanin